MGKSLVDNFDFLLFGQGTKAPFRGYVSSIDPTTAGVGVLIGGSQNTYLSLLGTVQNRPGLKRRGPADATAAGVVRSDEWETSLGITRVLRAVNGKLQVEFDSGSGIGYYDLLTGLTDDQLDFSFAPWYSETLQKDVLIFVNGEQELNQWGGGVALISAAANTAGIIDSTLDPNNITNANTNEFDSGGVNYVVGDLLTVSGGNADAIVEVDSIIAGGVKTASVASAGSGYMVGDLVKAGGGTTKALFRVTTIGGGGAVTGLQIVTAGVGNATAVGLATTNVLTGGSPSGLTITVTAVGNTIATWHFTNNGSGYAASSAGAPAALTGGSGTAATIWIISVTSGRITISGTLTAAQLGFSGELTPTDGTSNFSGGTIFVNGTTYTYEALGDNGFSFIGVTPDPTGLAGSVAVSTVIVSTRTASGNLFSHVFGELFTNDFVRVVGNQLYVGCYNARIIFVSADDNYLDFAVPALRAPGDADEFILDSNARGVTSKSGQKGNAVLFGSLGDSYSITRTQQVFTSADGATSYIYELDTIDKQTSADLSSPIDQNFIDSVGDTILFVDKNNQLRQFGTLRNLVTPVYPILSLDVYTELAGLDLTLGMLRAVAEQSGETLYITVPKTGTLYIYQIREQVDEVGNLRAQRLWQTPFIVGCSTVAVIDGVTYIYSNSNPQLYQMWDTGQYSDDSPSDEPIPYECHAIFAYMSLADRAQQLFFDKLYYEGYMTRGTTLYNNIYQEFQGSKNIVTVRVNKPIDPGKKLAVFYDSTAAPSLGDVSLGEIPLGEGVTAKGGAQIPKFRAIRRSQATDIFEFALDLASYDLDCNWQLLTLGVNYQSTTRRPTSIMA